ncbi:MAG TPA: cytochrome c3 family protein [Albitalea sp.]
MTMHRTLRGRIAPLAAGLALAAAGGTALAQIAQTRHNLGTFPGGTGVNQFSGTEELCVFCHTPHGSDTSAVVPLWNRGLPAPTSFTTYDSLGTSTLDARFGTVGSVSIACLSCHDGVTSMSAVINAPGAGTAGSPGWQAGTWSGSNQSGGILATGVITNLGRDLRDDHPIGVQYGGGGITLSRPAATTRDTDFRTASFTVLNGILVWWVDTEPAPNGTRQRSDMVLYTRAAGAGYTGQVDAEPFVECASCHDPHTTNERFMRIANRGSLLCLACHQK